MMRAFLLLLSVALLGAAPVPPPSERKSGQSSAPAERKPLGLSIVKVNSTNQGWDPVRPWIKKQSYSRRALGTVIGGGRVLVTAETVGNHNFVELEKVGSGEKTPASVERVDYDANLALLVPADAKFTDGLVPLTLDSGAKVGDRLSVVQFEANGDTAETPATLTSIQITGYPMDNMGLLSYRLSVPLQQRDASFTIPALRDGRLAGLLMRYDARSQTAEAIPPAVIRHFLAEVAKPEYGGFPRAGLAFSATRDPQLRRYLGLERPGGVYVTEVASGGAAEKAGLKTGDVILAVNGRALDQDGNYEDPEFGRIAFSHLTNTAAYPGDVVNFSILREREPREIPVKLAARDRSRIVSESYVMDRQPRFVVLGGLVFQELSRPYLQEWGGNWMKDAPQQLVYLDAFQNELPADGRKIVFLSQVLPTDDTIGYEQLANLVVQKVNGREIRSLDDLAAAAKEPVEGFHRIEVKEDPGLIFLDAAAVEKNREALQRVYALPKLENL